MISNQGKSLYAFAMCAVMALIFATQSSAAISLKIFSNRTDGVYEVGELASWRALVINRPIYTAPDKIRYTLRKGGGKLLDSGRVKLMRNRARFSHRLARPGTILVDVLVTNRAGQSAQALAGAAVAPEKIRPSQPCPADFDTFWQAKIQELSGVPENRKLTAMSSGRPGVDYSQISMDNIRSSKIHGQIARPTQGNKFPALLLLQWAGLYPLEKNWVTDRAAEGWLVLNISAHDLPIDQPQSFYNNLSAGALSNYTAIGNDEREQSYFLRMFLGCYRAVEYLSQRPDWDGRTLVVSGLSQGGFQGFAAAGLNPKVTGLMALVPAGCDQSGDLVGRKPGWPNWVSNGGKKDAAKVRETSRYFDGVNFAARVKCPALVGVGLIDTVSPPSGVFAAVNQLQGAKEIVVMPKSNHNGDNNSQAQFLKRQNAWREDFLSGLQNPAVVKTALDKAE